MAIKGRRRAHMAAVEGSGAAARCQDKQQQQQQQQCEPSGAESGAAAALAQRKEGSRPQVVAVERKKRRAVAVLRYSDGSRYEGQTSETQSGDGSGGTLLRHGQGVYVTHNGHVFDGEWVLGVFQGWVASAGSGE